MAAVRSALAMNPKSALIHFRLGEILAGQKRLAEARAAYEAAVAADPAFAPARRALREFPAGAPPST